jgi:uncharacterized membrane protein YkvA (DUF1232 family)
VKRELHRRVLTLPLSAKIRLVLGLSRDQEVPVAAKLLLPLIVLYTVMPFDLVSDDTPVLGQIDDLIVIVIGLAMFVMLIPEHVLAEHLAALE